LNSSIPPQSCDFLISGAGIIGLTVALELRKRFPTEKIVIVEKERRPGLHASGRNSGVLHTGIYYPDKTLKAKICASGARRMREFARENGISCREGGKIIVATCADEIPLLDRLLKNARDNKIRAEKLDQKGIVDREPHAFPGPAGLYCPEAAVIDSAAVVQKLYDHLTQKGVQVLFERKVTHVNPPRKYVETEHHEKLSYGFFLNCSGAYADVVAKKFGLCQDYSVVPFKGLYLKLHPSKTGLVRESVYPVPNPHFPFLGVHFTRVIGGEVYIGPTAIPALGRENYGLFKGMKAGESVKILGLLMSMYLKNHKNFRSMVHSELQKYHRPFFLKSARKLIPAINNEDLIPSSKVGIRPQLINVRKNELEMDFIM